MKLDNNSMVLYAITDRTWLGEKSLAQAVEEAIKGGATFVQLREKNISFDEFIKLAKEVKAVTDKYKIPFVINDNIAVACEVGADGVHIGQGDEAIKIAREILGKNKIIGISANNPQDAICAELGGADYIGAGSVFSTSTKLDAKNITIEVLRDIAEAVSIPVVAIGGINKENVINLSGCGIAGVCIVSAIFSKDIIKEAASELFKLSKQVVGKNL